MAKVNAEDFTGSIVGIVVAVIVVGAVAVPIITGTDGTPSGATYPIQKGTILATIVEILPVFLVLAVLMMIVYLFIQKKN